MDYVPTGFYYLMLKLGVDDALFMVNEFIVCELKRLHLKKQSSPKEELDKVK